MDAEKIVRSGACAVRLSLTLYEPWCEPCLPHTSHESLVQFKQTVAQLTQTYSLRFVISLNYDSDAPLFNCWL